MYSIHCTIVHGRGADLPFILSFGHGPILVQINLQSRTQKIRKTAQNLSPLINQYSRIVYFLFTKFCSMWPGD